MNTCKDCQFFSALDAASGQCKKNPPTPFMFIVQTIRNAPPSPQLFAAWPTVPPEGWCGAFERISVLSIN